MKRVNLKVKDVNQELAIYGIHLTKKDVVVLQEDEYKILFINNVPAFFYNGNIAVPTLKYLQQHPLLKKIVVDMGAIKFVVSGADIMRPGVVEIDGEIVKGELVMVIDQVNRKPLAVGKALYEGKEMINLKVGKVVQNIHYVGDALWKYA